MRPTAPMGAGGAAGRLPEGDTARLRTCRVGEREGAVHPAEIIDDLPLFRAAPPPAPAKPKESEAETRLRGLNPDALTPREALDLIYELKGLTDR